MSLAVAAILSSRDSDNHNVVRAFCGKRRACATRAATVSGRGIAAEHARRGERTGIHRDVADGNL
jgi:hypothetical protein